MFVGEYVLRGSRWSYAYFDLDEEDLTLPEHDYDFWPGVRLCARS